MYKLTVVSGPNAGTSYPLNEGETTLGRADGNTIVLPSSKVSKNHCAFSVSVTEILLRDLGSSNGTFVNGQLTKKRALKGGDRISLGEYVLELGRPVIRRSTEAPAVVGLGPRVPMQIQGVPVGTTNPSLATATAERGSDVPTDFKGKLGWLFEKYVMPLFYNMNLKQDWRTLSLVILAVFVGISILASVHPLIEANRRTNILEAGRRAETIAREIVDLNSSAMAARAETQTYIHSSLQRGHGVLVAVLTDLSNKVIAPKEKMNETLAQGKIAGVAVSAAKAFQKGREQGVLTQAGDLVVAVEPLKIFNPRLGKNEIVAMAVVGVDTQMSTLGLGEIGVIYSQSLLIVGITCLFAFLILYRLTVKRFEVLNDEIDRVLKGELSTVTHEFKARDFDDLWSVINSALQRVPKGGMDGSGSSEQSQSVDVGDLSEPIRAFADVTHAGVVLLDRDRKVLFLSSAFEEITGIDAMSATGNALTSVGRDQAFVALVSDMLNVCESGNTAREDFEFSGVAYQVVASALGSGSPKGFTMTLVKKGEEG